MAVLEGVMVLDRHTQTQPQGEWVDLTDDEILTAANVSQEDIYDLDLLNVLSDVRAIIAKFKEKNTPPVAPQSEPVAYRYKVINYFGDVVWTLATPRIDTTVLESQPLYTTPPSVEAWIDPNDKTQARYLPHIGEPVLFCHEGVTYFGKHTGGSFRTGVGVTAKDFDTWNCHWMYLPAAAIRGMK